MSFIYIPTKTRFLTAQINLDAKLTPAPNLKTRLITYQTSSGKEPTVDLSSRTNLSTLADIPVDHRIGPVVSLTNPIVDNGRFLADPVTFLEVRDPNGPGGMPRTINGLIIYNDTGDESKSPLIVMLNEGAGLPIIPNGSDIIINWGLYTDNTNRLIFTL